MNEWHAAGRALNVIDAAIARARYHARETSREPERCIYRVRFMREGDRKARGEATFATLEEARQCARDHRDEALSTLARIVMVWIERVVVVERHRRGSSGR